MSNRDHTATLSEQPRGELFPDRKWWSGKRVFLTGHTGFKGSWLALWLKHLGAEVMGYALAPSTKPSMFELVHLDKQLTHVEGDILDLTHMTKAAGDFRPDMILHLAAQAIVSKGYKAPASTMAANVQGTVHALEVARQVESIRTVVVVTTDKCYENREWVWPYREVDRLGGKDPYSASKACAEIVTSAYRQSFFSSDDRCAIATARAGNVFGGGDWADDRLIPDAVRAISGKGKFELRNPGSWRPWQHVVEGLLGYLMLAKALHERQPDCPAAVNFGSDPTQVACVLDVATAFYKAWGVDMPEQRPAVDSQNAFAEARRLSLDSSLAAATLGWQPQLPLDQAVQSTAAWYRAAAGGSAADELAALTIEQINQLAGTPA